MASSPSGLLLHARMKAMRPGVLEEATARLRDEFQPEEIYLFGSHAWGQPTVDGDVDLFVIVRSSDERPVQRAQRAHRCLAGLDFPKAVIVCTCAEVDRFKHLRASLVHQVLRRGRKLYG